MSRDRTRWLRGQIHSLVAVLVVARRWRHRLGRWAKEQHREANNGIEEWIDAIRDHLARWLHRFTRRGNA